MNKKNSFLNNLYVAFFAQIISLILSVFMSLIVPKVLTLNEYSYWQLFIFYVSYVGFFHFGLIDGLYLNLGGKNYKDLNYRLLFSEFKIFIIMELGISIIISLFALRYINNFDRLFVILMTSIYLVVNNLVLFFGYIFQAVNKTKIFSKTVIIDKICVLILISCLFSFHIKNFELYILSYLISKIVSLIYVIHSSKEIVSTKSFIKRKAVQKDYIKNLKDGINLTVANIASLLILGIGRIVIDDVWGIESFGKISLSLSLTNFFLMFIQQVSMVMFPTLKSTNINNQKQIYSNLRNTLSIVLPVALVLYIPLKRILLIWLPQYEESLMYLSLMLPMCIFDGKMQLLYNTYLKVYRKEKQLLIINITTFVLSTILVTFSAYILNNFFIILLSMLFSIAFRSIISEIYLSKLINLQISKNIFYEFFIVILFISLSRIKNDIFSFLLISVVYFIYLYLNKKILPQLKIYFNKR